MTRNKPDKYYYTADYGCHCTSAEQAAYRRGKEHERMNRDAQWERAINGMLDDIRYVKCPLDSEILAICRERVQREASDG
jgi:hypothetical protein